MQLTDLSRVSFITHLPLLMTVVDTTTEHTEQQVPSGFLKLEATTETIWDYSPQKMKQGRQELQQSRIGDRMGSFPYNKWLTIVSL